MNFQIVMQLIGRWGGTLNYFPGDPDARIGIAEEIVSMASAEEQVRWLVSRLPKLFKDWPAMHEVRAVFCSKFRPKDGYEVYSAIYIDGIPTEKEELPAIAAATMKSLPAGEPVSAARSLATTIGDLARAKSMANAGRPVSVREIPIKAPGFKGTITADQIEAEAQRLREAKAQWGSCPSCFLPHNPAAKCLIGEVVA